MAKIDERLEAIEADLLADKADVARHDSFFSLISILSDQSQFVAAIEAFCQREAEAKTVEADTAKRRKVFDERAQAKRSMLESEGAALISRLVVAEEEAGRLHAASAAQKKLVRAWTAYAEDEAVQSGFASPRRPAIHKARKAHGLKTDWVEDPAVDIETVSPSVPPSIFPLRERRTERPSRRFR